MHPNCHFLPILKVKGPLLIYLFLYLCNIMFIYIHNHTIAPTRHWFYPWLPTWLQALLRGMARRNRRIQAGWFPHGFIINITNHTGPYPNKKNVMERKLFDYVWWWWWCSKPRFSMLMLRLATSLKWWCMGAWIGVLGSAEFFQVYPLVNKKTIENGHLYWIYPLKMVISHSYVSLPEGIDDEFR